VSGDGRRARVGAARRKLTILLSVLVLGASMVVSIRRTAEGRRITEALTDLRDGEQLLRAQLAEEVLRVDSLSSLARIEDAAAELGLRWPRDDEWELMPDVETTDGGSRPRRSGRGAK
jgi:hypothetical protein